MRTEGITETDRRGFDGPRKIEPCDHCGVGEMKIQECNVDSWCEDCCLHMSRCKCNEEAAEEAIDADRW